MAGKKSSRDSETYSRDQLLHNAQALFGVKPEALAGALRDVRHMALTLDEARGFVSQFMKRKVM